MRKVQKRRFLRRGGLRRAGRPAPAAFLVCSTAYPYPRAFGVRAKYDGAIGILSITDTHTDKNGFNHVEGSKTARVAPLAFFFPNLKNKVFLHPAAKAPLIFFNF